MCYNAKEVGKALPKTKFCTVHYKPISFEVDSGVPCTLMSLNLFYRINMYLPALEPTDIKLSVGSSADCNIP